MKNEVFYLAHLNRSIREGCTMVRQDDGSIVLTDRYGVPHTLSTAIIMQLDTDSQNSLMRGLSTKLED